MTKTRLEAFSDGVIAIAITIMVLELKVPHGTDWTDVLSLLPVLLSYLLSYIYVGIYWVNHHHLLHPVRHVDGPTLWANLHLLFWISLIPFVTSWVAEHRLESAPVALYGVVLLMCSIAFKLLAHTLVAREEAGSGLALALGKGRKNWISIGLYALAIPLSLWQPALGTAVYVLVAGLWFIPDRHIETLAAH